jgi:hypothetical protein
MMPRKFGEAPGHQQAAFTLWWWKAIEETLKLSAKPAFMEVPWQFPLSRQDMKLKEHSVDRQRIHQKARKAARRSG